MRVNQSFFRNLILSSYNNCCCITGIQQSELLIAGHISPWGLDEKNRLNPRNGIAINALHEKWNIPRLSFDDFKPELDHDYHEFESLEVTNESTTENCDISCFLTMITDCNAN